MVVALEGCRLVEQPSRLFQQPVTSIHPAWSVLIDGKSVSATVYFADAIRAEKERQQRQRQHKLEVAAFRQAEEEAINAAERKLFDGFPVVETVIWNGGPADLKWHNRDWWIVTATKMIKWTYQDVGNRKSLLAKLKRRCPEFAAYREELRLQRSRQREVATFQAMEQQEAARIAAEQAKKERAQYWSTAELLELGDGWTRHYIRKFLGTPDKIEEFTVGRYSDRKDVVRHLWLKTRVTEALLQRSMCRCC